MSSEVNVKILIVDDEISVSETLVDYLEDYGFNVRSAGNSKEAFEILAKETFDVALVDMRLPMMDGDLLVLKIHDMQPNIRFLIHTGSSAFNIPQELQALGIEPEHVFLKPIRDLNMLRNAITDIVRERGGG